MEPIRSRDRRYGQLTEVILLNEADRRRIARFRVGTLLLVGGFLVLPVLLWTPVDGDPGAPEFFRRPTPHEAYFLKLAREGIGQPVGGGTGEGADGGTGRGTDGRPAGGAGGGAGEGAEGGIDGGSGPRSWFEAAFRALEDPLRLRASYRDEGRISPDAPHAWSFRLRIERGQRLAVAFAQDDPDARRVFVDLYRPAPVPGRYPVPLEGSETDGGSWAFEPTGRNEYVVRLQPELASNGPYRLSVRVEPSLLFPVTGRGMGDVGSFFGDPREGGRRTHRGVDIFAPRGTPVIAAADGIVLSVDTTTLGGRVVWQRTSDGRYGLYYAHLDRPLVQEGQAILAGDTVGLVGNTGNARTTPPHLHFAVYGRREGAVDPWYFIAPVAGADGSAEAPPPHPSLRAGGRISGPGENRDSSPPVPSPPGRAPAPPDIPNRPGSP